MTIMELTVAKAYSKFSAREISEYLGLTLNQVTHIIKKARIANKL